MHCNIFKTVLILLCFCAEVRAQDRNITGKVGNTQGEALVYANIVILDAVDSSHVAHSNTDGNGNYRISFRDRAGGVFIRASYLGYKSHDKPVTAETLGMDFILESSSEILPKAVIRSRMLGATIKGDTIAYNLDKYTDGTEQTLKDILQKLPGIEVDENGKVSAQGKPVEHLLIDGKEFFLNQSQMATRNLPAKLVGGVDLINNYTDLSILGDSKPQGISALNISIKEEYRNRITGTLTGAGGIETKYSAKSNLFQFGSNLGTAFIGDAGNTGQMAFTLYDYIQFQGGASVLARNSRIPNTFTLDNTNYPRESFSEEVRSKPSETGAVNFSYIPNKKLRINSYIIGNHQTQKGEESIRQTFVDNSGANIDILNKRLYEKNAFWFTNMYLSGDWKPSENFFVSNRLMFSGQNMNYNTDIVKFGMHSADTMLSELQFAPVDLKNYLLMLYRTPRGLLSVDVFYRYYDNRFSLDLDSDSRFLGLPLQTPLSGGLYSAVQDNEAGSQELFAKAKYSYALPHKISLVPQFGISYSSQDKNTVLFQRDGDVDRYFSPENEYVNSVLYDNFDVYGGLDITKSAGIFRFEAGLEGHYHRTLLKTGQDFETEKWSLHPYLRSSIYFSAAHYLSATFFTGQSMRQIDLLGGNMAAISHQAVRHGSTTDCFSPQQSAMLHYVFSNFNIGTTLNLTLSYDKTDNTYGYDMIPYYDYSENILRRIGSVENVRSRFHLRQSLGDLPFDVGLDINASSQSGINFVNSKENKIVVNSIGSNLTVMSFSQSIVNGELGFEVLLNQNKSSLANRSMNLLTLTPAGKIRIKGSERWFVNSSLRYYKYDSKDTKMNVAVLDATFH
ncbi:MAG: carboxypeptidase-like regulatory domain-containing protein, partial [Tannerella sp.]|nr:carboxypeptidase-like regulatory domain-containing protein [Tannerella sp.]